jgi:hypothetical protein
MDFAASAKAKKMYMPEEELASKSKPRIRTSVLISFLLLTIAAIAYAKFTGILLPLNDSVFLLDRAKHLALSGDLDAVVKIYPPLESILLAIGFIGGSSRRALEFAHILNVGIYLTCFFPVYRLCRSYCNLSSSFSPWVTLLLLLSPATFVYGSFVLSEMLFIGLFTWFLYFYLSEEVPYFWRQNWCALLLGMMLLTRYASVVVPLAVIANDLIGKAFFQTSILRRTASHSPFFLAACAGCLILVFWTIFESAAVHYDGKVSYGSFFAAAFQPQMVEPIADNFFKSLLYFICSPLNPAVVVLLAMFTVHPREVISESAFRFFLIVALSASVLWVLMIVPTDPSAGFLNRYLAPFVILPQLIAIKFWRSGHKRPLGTCLLVVLMVLIAGAPANLSGGFPDADTLFMGSTDFLGDIAAIKNILFAAIMAIMILLLMAPWQNVKVLLFLFCLGLNAVCVGATGLQWKRSILPRAAKQSKCARLINDKSGQADAYYDAEVNLHAYEVNWVRLFVNRPLKPCRRQDLTSVADKVGHEILFVSDKPMDGFAELCRETFWKKDIYVYLVQTSKVGKSD